MAIYATFLISNLLDNQFLFMLPILVLAICDPMAGILGLNIKNYNHTLWIFGYNTKKTVLGSGSFLVSCFIICVIALYYYRMAFDLKTFWLALSIAVVSTLTELFSWWGLDNLLIPLSVLVLLLFFL
jgi:dolichol kinase